MHSIYITWNLLNAQNFYPKIGPLVDWVSISTCEVYRLNILKDITIAKELL